MIYFISIFTIIVGYISSYKLSNKINVDLRIFNIFFIIKFLYLLVSIYFNIFDEFGTDSKSSYYDSSFFSFNSYIIGNNLLYGINFFFKDLFYFDYFSVNIITFFPVIWATLLLLSIINTLKSTVQKFLLYIMLALPSLNFWTNLLSKDMLSYCILSFLVFSMLKKNNLLIIFGLFFLFLVRPYVLFFFLITFLIFGLFFFIKNIVFSKFKIQYLKIFLFLIFFIISSVIIFFISKKLLGSFGADFLSGNFIAIVESLQRHYTNTPLGIPTDTNFIIRFFSYFFYPFPWSNLYKEKYYLIMILENCFLIFLIIFTLYKNFKIKSNTYIKDYYYLIPIFSFILIGLVLSLVTSNLGIAFRQKWMILPFIIILISFKFKKITKF